MPSTVYSPDEKSASDLPGPSHPVKPFGEAGPSGASPAQTSPAQAPDFCILYCKYGISGGPVPGNFSWGWMFFEVSGQTRFSSRTPEDIFRRSVLFRRVCMTAPHRWATAGEVLFSGEAKIRAYRHPMRFALHIQKTGQPPWVARFLMIYVTYQQLPLLLQVNGHCPLLIAHC